jgi:hypothetical protein
VKVLFNISLILTIVVFSGCSTKKVFKPQSDKVVGSWKDKADLNESIVDVTANGALLKDGNILSHDTFIGLHVNTKTERLVDADKEWIVTTQIDGNTTLTSSVDSRKKESFDLKKTVAAASVKDDLLAVVFASNELAIYSIKTKDILFHSEGNTPLAVDAKIVNPYFLDDLVLFLTLDGKIVIVNSKEKKILRSMIISSADKFNNVIAFNVAGDNLIAATGNEILSLANKDIRAAYEIRNMRYDAKDEIYIATKQGEVLNLTSTLQVKSKTKFPFAHFLGMITTDDKVYVLEKEGYIIALEKDLKSYKVYKASIDGDSYVYAGDKAFYVDDEFFSVKK